MLNRRPYRMISILRWCPGALGLVLRKHLFPPLFKRCGKNVLFGRLVNISNPDRIVIGNHVVISDRVTLDAKSHSDQRNVITLEDHVFIGTGTKLNASSAPIRICSGANLSSSCSIHADVPVRIGRDTLLAAYCHIGERNIAKRHIHREMLRTRIEVGHSCWLGVRVSVPTGIRVGNGAIVGAHASVREDLPDYTIAVGRPAVPIRSRLKENRCR